MKKEKMIKLCPVCLAQNNELVVRCVSCGFIYSPFDGRLKENKAKQKS